jgi:hypothetical protein
LISVKVDGVSLAVFFHQDGTSPQRIGFRLKFVGRSVGLRQEECLPVCLEFFGRFVPPAPWHLRIGERMIVKGGCRLGRHHETLSSPVRLVVTRLASGELLALACSGRARHALARYRQRWTIETMFGNLKTKGFALEATHLTDPDKLGTLLALLAFALTLTVKTGVAMARLHPISVKNHGRRARSLFALGLHTLRKIFVAASPAQIIVFLDQLLSPKLPVKPLRALAFR